MHKKALLITACLGLALHLQGCTSNDSKQDSEAASEYDSAELENLEGGGDASAATSTDQISEDSLGETSSTASTDSISDFSGEASTTTSSDSLPAGDLAAGSSSSSTDSTSLETPVDSSSATDILPPTSSDTSSFSASEPSSTPDYKEEKPKPAAIPLQKMAASPWKVGSGWANTIYFARPGDSLSSVSQTIYGTDKTAELRKINPTYNSRDLKPGDKIYYVSPNRAEDSAKMMTYFEDTGVQPETYVAQKGENLRKVSKKLLGYDNAWKEVWAINSVESKTTLDEGTELKYWKGSAVAAAPAAPATPANAEPAAPPPVAQEMAPPPVEPHSEMAAPPQELPPPPTLEQQANMDLPPPPTADAFPPPPPQDMAQNSLPPPPPPPVDMAPPPPPPNMDEQRPHDAGSVAGEMDSDTTLALTVAGLAAAGLALLIIMRKKRRQKELEQALSDTQVGT